MWLHFRICLYRIQVNAILICKQTPLIMKYFYKSNFIWRANFINIPIHFYSVWLHKYYNNIEVHIAHFFPLTIANPPEPCFHSFYLHYSHLYINHVLMTYNILLLLFSQLSQLNTNLTNTQLDLLYPISHSSIIINLFPIFPSAQSLPPIVH